MQVSPLMEGSARYELTGSPESNFTGNYQNGQRGCSGPALGRASSFRESSETGNFGSAKINSRVNGYSSRDVPTLSHCLMLEPIPMGDSKCARPGDLKKVFGFSSVCNSEDNSFGSAHLRNPPIIPVEELKRLRACVADTCLKASGRARNLDEHLSKLNKYFEAQPSKKQQLRGDILANERSSGSTLKIGSQVHRNPPEANPRFDDRTKSVGLSKRMRTSVTEMRGECRKNGMLRQPLMVTKDREMVKDNNADSDVGEEKLRKLPAGGEGWDKRMKRRRSVGAGFSRSVDKDNELKRAVHNKPISESSLQPSDFAQLFRSGSSGGNNKIDPVLPTASSTARVTLKNDQEKAIVSKDLSGGQLKERPSGKVNVKLNSREDNHALCPTPHVKGKASRGARSGFVNASNSSANVPRLSRALESWEQPQAAIKPLPIVGANNRKRGMNGQSPSPPFTQWGGQRPHKISRTRRTNLGPVSNHDELPMQSDGCFPSDFGPRISIGVGSNNSHVSKIGDNTNQNFKVQSENAPSPAKHSESEEYGPGEIRILENSLGGRDLGERTANPCHSIGPSAVSVRHNSVMAKEFGDGVKRQGRSGRMTPFSRSRISPKREKLDNVVSIKPLQNNKSGTDKSASKSGRPLKKLSDRKSLSRLGHSANAVSPDYSGESDDDREELLAAANMACTYSTIACSSKFWKSAESLFSPLRPDDKTFLSEQLTLAEQLDANSYPKLGNTDSVESNMDDRCLGEQTTSTSAHRNIHMLTESELMNSSHQMDSQYGFSAAEIRCNVNAPLYQRLLSALILEDEIEECEETGFGRPRSLINEPNMFPCGDGKFNDRPEFFENNGVTQNWMNGHARKVFPVPPVNICNGELKETGVKYEEYSAVEMVARRSQHDYIPKTLLENNGGVSPFGFQHDQKCIEENLMHELRSIGLFVDHVPSLDDKEEEKISHEILQLERLLHEQIGKKKAYLEKISTASEEEKDLQRDPEQISMDKLVELAYKKSLSTRGSMAIKYGVAKVKKPLALAFARRTLARCHKFEDFGTSCFSESPLRETIRSLPPQFTDNELLLGINDGSSIDGTVKNVPILSRGKKREVLLDDVGSNGISRLSTTLSIVGTKGKRNERDTSNKNNVPIVPRTPVGASKGERRSKAKPKQKTAQLSASGNGFLPKFKDATNSSGSGSGESGNTKKKDIRTSMCFSNTPSVSSQDNKETGDFAGLPIRDIDGMNELGVDTEIDLPSDLNSWLNIEEDSLQEHFSVGLETPMDDLSDLLMF